MVDFPGGVLIESTNGWFLARMENGAVTVDRAGSADPGPVFTMHDSPGGGVLLGTMKGLFLAHTVNGTVVVDRVASADTGRVIAMRDLSGGVVLLQAENG